MRGRGGPTSTFALLSAVPSVSSAVPGLDAAAHAHGGVTARRPRRRGPRRVGEAERIRVERVQLELLMGPHEVQRGRALGHPGRPDARPSRAAGPVLRLAARGRVGRPVEGQVPERSGRQPRPRARATAGPSPPISSSVRPRSRATPRRSRRTRRWPHVARLRGPAAGQLHQHPPLAPHLAGVADRRRRRCTRPSGCVTVPSFSAYASRREDDVRVARHDSARNCSCATTKDAAPAPHPSALPRDVAQRVRVHQIESLHLLRARRVPGLSGGEAAGHLGETGAGSGQAARPRAVRGRWRRWGSRSTPSPGQRPGRAAAPGR